MAICGGVEEFCELIVELDAQRGCQVSDGRLWVVEKRWLEGCPYGSLVSMNELDVGGVVEWALQRGRFWFLCATKGCYFL